MINWLFRLFLAFNSTSLLIVIYLIKSGINIQLFPPCIFHIPNVISYFFYILVVLVLTLLSLYLSRNLAKEDINKGDIISLEYANDAFLPSYLGYFFVALDVPNFETFYFVYPIIFIFTFLSQTLYFNPIFLLFNYHFYNLTTDNNVRIFMITKQKIKDPKNVEFIGASRINNFTYIDNK
jgi:hypothetical protein